MKRCSKCKVEKGTSSFTRDANRRDGLSPWCKDCNKVWREANKERLREYYKAWRMEHPNYTREYNAANADKRRAYSKAWREANQERRRAYLDANRESAREYQRAYAIANRERSADKSARRRAMKVTNGVTPYARTDIYESSGWRCYLCGGPVDPSLAFPDLMSKSIDHIVPIIKGGRDAPDNVALAHWGCNLSKGARLDRPQPLATVAVETT